MNDGPTRAKGYKLRPDQDRRQATYTHLRQAGPTSSFTFFLPGGGSFKHKL